MTNLCATRRWLLGAALAVAGGGARPAAAATAVPEAATLLAPGPEEGPAASFAARAARGLARGLVQAAALRVSVVGGPDGITAANRFAATAPPDGRMLLTLPGPAAHALLVGDGRARFEPRHWPAVTGSLMTGLLAGRGALGEAGPVRLALPGPAAPEAAALLALELLGRTVVPVFLPPGVAAEAAVAVGVADAAVLVGRSVGPRAAALGLAPWFTFDGPSGAREPGLAEVPAFGELLPDPSRPELLAGLRAAGAAMRVRGLLVLPALTSADAVALWRGAARRWTEDEQDIAEPGTRRVGAEAAADALATLCPPPEVAVAYREWLQRRMSWRAG
jgi:hypothetical protein